MSMPRVLTISALLLAAIVCCSATTLWAQDQDAPQSEAKAVANVEVPAIPAPALAPTPSAAPVAAPTQPLVEESRDLEYYQALADVHMNYQKYDEAKKSFNKALELVKSEDRKKQIYLRLGDLYLRQGDKLAAVKQIELGLDGIKDTFQSMEYNRRLSEIYKDLKEYKKAEKCYQYIIKNSDNSWEKANARKSLFEIYKLDNRLDSYVAGLEKQRLQEPKNTDILWNLNVIYQDVTPNAPKLIAVLEKLLEIEPQKRELFDALSRAYEAQLIDQKITTAQKMLNSCPDAEKNSCYDRLYGLYASKGDWVNASDIAIKLVEADPKSSYNLRRLLEVKVNQKMIDEAYALFAANLVKIENPTEKVEIELYMASVLESAGKMDESLKLVKQASEIVKEDYQKQRVADQLKQLTARMKK
jgi:tetratricopeptide (TPR) repeat protein